MTWEDQGSPTDEQWFFSVLATEDGAPISKEDGAEIYVEGD